MKNKITHQVAKDKGQVIPKKTVGMTKLKSQRVKTINFITKIPTTIAVIKTEDQHMVAIDNN